MGRRRACWLDRRHPQVPKILRTAAPLVGAMGATLGVHGADAEGIAVHETGCRRVAGVHAAPESDAMTALGRRMREERQPSPSRKQQKLPPQVQMELLQK